MGHASRSLLFSGTRFQLYEIVIDGRSSEHFKKPDDDLFEFKAHQVRIFCAFRGKSILVLTHGIMKKKDKHDRKDMDRAKQLLKQLDEQKG
jgi:hypothetical protein